ncbi:unnamed protein product [Hanseniaspora opuntiae]
MKYFGMQTLQRHTKTLTSLTQNATVGAPDSIMSFDKLNKSPVSSKETEKSISSLNVEINFQGQTKSG